MRSTNLRNKGLISADRRASLLSCLQYPVHTKSSTKDLSLPTFELRWNTMLSPEAYRYAFHIGRGEYRRFPAWILT